MDLRTSKFINVKLSEKNQILLKSVTITGYITIQYITTYVHL